LGNASETGHGIILFDGICNFCNASVQFVLKRDKEGYFRFASQQSEAGQELIHRYGLDKVKNDSIFFIEDGKAYIRSMASLRIARKIPGFWKVFYVFRYVPSFLRDGIYDLIARNRYHIFGKRDTCMVPKAEWRDRFLE
jgi:predicted DCC family thiol-disulfide oxidoreductase YuxK